MTETGVGSPVPVSLVFAAEHRFPVLGWEAFRGTASTPTEVRALLDLCQAYGCDWYQVITTADWTVSASGLFAAPTVPGYTEEVRLGWEAFRLAMEGRTP